MIVIVAESYERVRQWCADEGINLRGREPRVVVLTNLADVDLARGLTWQEGDRLIYRGFPPDPEAGRRIHRELAMMGAPLDGPTG